MPKSIKQSSPPSLAAKTKTLILSAFTDLLGTSPRHHLHPSDAVVLAQLDQVIQNSKQLSYRDALVVQFGYWLANGAALDITVRQAGGRGVAGWLGTFLAAQHISAVADAFQNIGKNSTQLTRGNLPAFDSVLRWGSDPVRTIDEIAAVFHYTCARIAENARPILPMPSLNRGGLTFSRVCALLSRLYAIPSAGAFEQFSIAALLHALVEQQGETQYRVTTKNLNASDKSSRTAGDVQILIGNRVVEALEVTANDWTTKMAGADKTIKDNDLSRLTILASGVRQMGDALFAQLDAAGIDLSVLELKSFAFSLVSALTRSGRDSALIRLYEMLDRLQPKTEIVNEFVNALFAAGLCEAGD